MNPEERAVLETCLGIKGHMMDIEIVRLYQLAKASKFGIIEIGSYQGRSTVALSAGALHGNGVKVWSIDPFMDFEDLPLHVSNQDKAIFFQNIVKTGSWDNVNIVNATSYQASYMFHVMDQVDLIFIDGDHARADEDRSLFLPCLKIGGLMVFHDVNREDVKAALDKMNRIPCSLRPVEFCGNMAIYQKT